jgi:hypothetical protein
VSWSLSRHVRELSRCGREDCRRNLGPDNRSGFCAAHAPKTHRHTVNVGDAHRRAEAFVTAWLVADYEPDDVDGRYMSERSVERLIDRVEDLLAGQVMRPPVPSNGSRARRDLNAGLIKIGTPREASADVAGEPDVRAPECPAYTLCLEHVLKQGWRGWTCRGCMGPGTDESKREHAEAISKGRRR